MTFHIAVLTKFFPNRYPNADCIFIYFLFFIFFGGGANGSVYSWALVTIEFKL